MIQGKDSIRKIVQDLEIWAQNHNVRSLEEIRGKALENLKAFDEMKFEPAVSHANGVPCGENCSLCVNACMYSAISRSGDSISIDRSRCTGCGLCTSICPAKKLKLDL
jgi:Fe-S-cluster-containing hydrogenase components 2